MRGLTTDTRAASRRPAVTLEQIHVAIRRAWFPVARAADISTPRRVVLLEEELVVFREKASNRPVVASNRCPHRGAGLHLGTLSDDTIACAYHGWRFSTHDGRCTAVPSLGDTVANPSKARLSVYPATERFGLIWTCIGNPLHDPPEIVEINEDWTIGNGAPIEVNVGFGAATENFRDVSHFPFVHRETFGKVAQEVPPLNVQRQGTHVSMVYPWTPERAPGNPLWDKPVTWHYHVIAPALAYIIFDHGEDGRHALINAVRPVNHEESVIYWAKALEPEFNLLTLGECLALETAIYAEDMPILESLRPREIPFSATAETVEYSTRADRYTLAYRDAVLDFVAQADGCRDCSP